MRLRIFGAPLALAFVAVLAAGPAMAEGDPAKGKKIFKKCKICHAVVLKDKRKRIGPNLVGVFGRKAGTAPGFKKYTGLKGADFVWDEAHLDEYLANPKKFIKKIGGKKSKMILKTKKASQRANIIAYLKTLK